MRVDGQKPGTRRKRRASGQLTAKPVSIKYAKRRSGGCAQKAIELTPGDLLRVARATETVARQPDRGALSDSIFHATGQGREHRDDSKAACHLYGGMARLLRLLGNSRGADRGCALWRQWKTPRRSRAALLELGVRPQLAANTAGSGRGPWYLARAKALSVGASNAYFRSLGLPSLFENY